MTRLLKKAASGLWAGVLALIVLAGVLTVLAQVAVPLLGGFRTDVERWLESALRTPVRIEGLAVRWRTRGPELVARNVAVLDLAGQPSVELDELTVAVGIVDALRERRLRPSRIGIAGVRLHVVRKADGSLGVRGVRARQRGAAEEADSAAAAMLLLLPERLAITDAELTLEDRMRGRPPLSFRNASLTLRNDGERHRIDAALELPDARRTRVRLAGELTADPAALADWRADLYLETAGAELAPLLAHVTPASYRLEGLHTDLRWWSRWEGGEPLWIEGQATLRDTGISGVASGRGLRVDRATGRFRWDRRDDGWILRVTGFSVDRPDRPGEPSEWALAWRRGTREAGAGLRLVGDRLALEDVAAILAVRPPGGERLGRLLDAGPEGLVRDFDLQAVRRTAGDWWWSAAGTLDRGGLAGGGTLPEIRNLGLGFAADATGGRVTLTTRDAEIRAPDLFRRPISVGELGGELTWRAQGGGWRVEGTGLRLADPQLRLEAGFELDIGPDGAATLDLEATLGALPVARALALLPVGAMDPRLVSWLDGGLREGTIASGSCRLQGPLADFPFEERRTGRFELVLDLEDAVLDYAPGWPTLSDADGRLRVDGFRVQIDLAQGRIYDTRIEAMQARIEAPPGAPVEVEGTLRGPLRDPLRLLRESPLAADFGEIAGNLEGTGEVRLDLDFAVPFEDGATAKERLAGAVVFAGNDLSLAGRPLTLEGLAGRLGFDLRGLKARDIQARLLGTPAVVDVQTDKSGSTTITAELRRLDVRALEELAGGSLAVVRGAAAAKVALEVPPLRSKDRLALRLTSDLRGVAIDLPAPLGKAADQARPLAVELGLAPDAPLALSARLGADLDLAAQLDPADGRPLRATLMLGGARAEPPRADRHLLRGRVSTVDLSAWLGWLGTLPPPAPGTPARPPFDAELSAQRLMLGDTALNDARLTVRETADGWQGEIRATELEGSFRYPRRPDQGTASLSLDRLAVRLDPTAAPSAAPPQGPRGAPAARPQDPRQLPAAVVEVKRLQLNGRDLGNARLAAGRVEKGLQIRELSIDGPAGRLSGGGDWLLTEAGPRTALNFALDTPDFGDLIVALGFADSIDRGPARLNGELSWPGSPHDVTRDRITGRVDLEMRAGRFLDIDPGVGRVMGLLNIAAIQRRLTLDFSDLFKKGLGFDSVTGHFDLQAGVVRTQDLRIQGPSGVIDITGRTDVVAQEFDQTVTVTPSLGSTLPIAGAVVGGPVVGAALLVVQGLVGKQVDQIGAVRYSVRGPWSNPDIEVLAGRPLRELLQDAAKGPAAPSAPAAGAQQAPAPVEGRRAGDPAPEPAPAKPFQVPGIH